VENKTDIILIRGKLLTVVFILFLILSLSGCEGKDRFYPPDLPEILCVSGILSADEISRSIFFEKSFQLEYKNEFYDSIRNLSFSISDIIMIKYEHNEELSYPRKITMLIPDSIEFLSGEKYILKAEEKGSGEIYSEIVVPESPSGLNVRYVDYITSYLPPPRDCHNPIRSAILDISFTTEAGAYYYILINGTNYKYHPGDRKCLIGYSVLESNSSNFEEILPSMFKNCLRGCFVDGINFPDEKYTVNFFEGNTVPGNQCRLTIKIDMHVTLFDYDKPINIKLFSIPEELYLFEKSLYLYRRSARDPFSEPVYLNGNIKGGNGIFAVCRSISVPITIPWMIIF
jgi:hypothetical protein